MSKKKHKNKSHWSLPEDYRYYFDASSDEEFKAKHPVGYFFVLPAEL